YGHCSQILVSAGQEVKDGDVIAKVGNTGNSTGAHLHLEVLVDGQYLNPLYFADPADTSERHLPEVGAGGT
ncbi:M23 family metallopeptidase, partial [Coprococcus eutactus]|uniref:M23 family metallopeptidase n=1 Tax=Coprococcus eutactus TaxID=33043 RepID=UPI00210ECF66